MPKKPRTAPAKPASAPPASSKPLTGPQVGSVAPDVESFVSDDAKSDSKFIRGPRKFKGQILAEYSTGVRLIWLNLMNDGDSSQQLGASMVWLLIQLETFRAYAAKQTLDGEQVWESAHTSLLLLCDNRVTTRAKVLLFASRMTLRELNQCVIMSNAILDEAAEEEVEAEPEAPAPPPDALSLPADAITTTPGN